MDSTRWNHGQTSEGVKGGRVRTGATAKAVSLESAGMAVLLGALGRNERGHQCDSSVVSYGYRNTRELRLTLFRKDTGFYPALRADM